MNERQDRNPIPEAAGQPRAVAIRAADSDENHPRDQTCMTRATRIKS